MNVSKLKPFDKIEIVRKCTGLSITQKLILLVIASHLGKNEFCFISLTSLQKECCIKKRSALTDNLESLIKVDILWRIPPSKGFKSNRYGINFNLLVTNGHYCSDPRLPDRSPTVTRLVTYGHPKRNINKVKEIERENLSSQTNLEEQKPSEENKAEKARQEIRKICNLKRTKDAKAS